MRLRLLWLVPALALTLPAAALARSSHSGSHSSHSSSKSHSSSSSGKHHKSSSKCSTCTRDSHGKIKRDPEMKRQFEQAHPCPSTGKTSGKCPGYVVDHVKPLACGGADAPANMQWQTKADAKAKDKWERNGCKGR